MRTKKNKGFSLVEVLIAMSLTITFIGLVTNFLYSFNKTSLLSNKRADLSSELRNVNRRLQKEIQNCSSILASYTPPSVYFGSATPVSISSDANRVIFTRSVYNKSTFVPYTSNLNDTNKNDVVIIEYEKPSSTVKFSRILFSLIPASATASDPSISKSSRIIKQVLTKNVINSTNSKVFTPFDAFKYFGPDNADTSSNKSKTSLIEFNIQGKIQYGDLIIEEGLISKANMNNHF